MGCFESRPLSKNYFTSDLNIVGAQCMFINENEEVSSMDALQHLFIEGQGNGLYGEWDIAAPVEQRKVVIGNDLKWISQKKFEEYPRKMLGMIVTLLKDHKDELEIAIGNT